MKVRKVSIKNFRGIKSLDWSLPDSTIFCLIGKGDSTKSTLLEAIRFAFYPHWNLTFSDSDFHNCVTTEPISIEVTIGDLTSDFLSLNKYGQYLRGWNKQTLEIQDEPDDNLEEVLTIYLSVGVELEPKWEVICDRNPEGVDFKAADRGKCNVSEIGVYSDRHLTWSNGSALAKLTESQDLNISLNAASRSARNTFNEHRDGSLKNFDEAASRTQTIAQELGVPVNSQYQAHLDLDSINIKLGGLTLHDGDVPVRQLGLGSRRILQCGIQKMSLSNSHITLFDELEVGLEPQRISRLLKHIKSDITGQYFLTTHSPIVLRELSIQELHIVHQSQGAVTVVPTANQAFQGLNIQGNIRSSAEAFLSKKIIVCEGATEVGFLRGLDDRWLELKKNSFTYQGVALLDSGGAKKIKGFAESLKALNYEISVLADADSPGNFSPQDAQALVGQGIEVIMWADNLALEQRAMTDLPWEFVLQSVQLAKDEFGYPVQDQVNSQLKGNRVSTDIEHWTDSIDLRNAIGKAALSGSWFKNISRGERWFEEISSVFFNPDFPTFSVTDLEKKLDQLRLWIDCA